MPRKMQMLTTAPGLISKNHINSNTNKQRSHNMPRLIQIRGAGSPLQAWCPCSRDSPGRRAAGGTGRSRAVAGVEPPPPAAQLSPAPRPQSSPRQSLHRADSISGDLVRVSTERDRNTLPRQISVTPLSTDSRAALTRVCGCSGGRPEREASAGSLLWVAEPAPEREPRAWRGGRRPAAENAQHRLTDMENPQTQTEMLTGHEDR